VVCDVLADHLAHHAPGPDGLVFTNTIGQPWRRNRFSDLVRRSFDRAGLYEASFHDCRHYYASLLISDGPSVKVIQQRLGHASAVQTLDTYGHLWPDSEDETRAPVDRVLGSLAAHPRPIPAVSAH
jgi:integrase